MIITIVILAVSAVFFAMGKVRSDIVALCALICLMLFGILTPQEALAGFSNSVVIMMIGLFVVGGAVCQTGLAKMLGGKIINLAGNSEVRLFLLVMLATAGIGAFVSNTGTVALMLPIVVSLAAGANINASRLLMPLAFASSMGGMLTLIGTPPNLVIQETLTGAGHKALSFFSFLPVGLVCLAVGIMVLLPMSRWLLSKNKERKSQGADGSGKTLDQLVEEYRLEDNLSVLRVNAGSSVIGKSIAELDIRSRYGLSILEVRHEPVHGKGLMKNVEQIPGSPETRLREGDLLYFVGDESKIGDFASENGLSAASMPTHQGAGKKGSLGFYDIGMAEIVLLPDSPLVNRLIKESGFRTKYSINVIGIRRHGQYIMNRLPDEKLRSGDVLLVQGTWGSIARLNSEDERWVVLGQPLREAAKVTLDYKAPVAAAILLAMVAMMVFDFIPVAPVTAVMIAAVLMVLAGCFRNVEAAYKTINWESIVLIAAMMPMSVALEKTGTSAAISHFLVGGLAGTAGPAALLAGIYFTTSLMTMFISNTATAVLMAPIALSSANELGVSPYSFLFAVAVGASMCFASPFSTPPNALVMQAGRYTFMDYVKVGLPLQIIMGIVMTAVLPLLFPF